MNYSITEYSKTAAALAELAEKYQGIVYDVLTPAGLKDAKAARAELRAIRIDLEKTRKEIKSPALLRCQLIDSEAKKIAAELEALENPIDAQIKAEEERKEFERTRAEREAKEKAEAEERAAKEAEEKRMAEERAEIARQQAEIEEQKRIARLIIEEEQREARLKIEEAERAARLAREEADRAARIEREKEEAKLKAERDRIDAERRAAEEKERKAREEAEEKEREIQRKKEERLGARDILKLFRERHGEKIEFAEIITAIDNYFAAVK